MNCEIKFRERQEQDTESLCRITMNENIYITTEKCFIFKAESWGKGSECQKTLRQKSKKEHRKSKIQNVERSERQKFEKDQNVESLICLIFKF